MSTFESKVLTQLDAINKRLSKIETRVSGDEDDPFNRGIYGALATVEGEVKAINKQQRRFTDDIVYVKEEQAKQKAWNKGAASAAGVNAVGVAAVLVKLFS